MCGYILTPDVIKMYPFWLWNTRGIIGDDLDTCQGLVQLRNTTRIQQGAFNTESMSHVISHFMCPVWIEEVLSAAM